MKYFVITFGGEHSTILRLANQKVLELNKVFKIFNPKLIKNLKKLISLNSI